ncbi:MAG: hypothetical protein HeimC2_18440 [Candidatus Heimdallarchaeota archaeon LC_2]|nr:MAG: hypothetical protein HeimC2_18440 [Candidatus Heimdallarchaeota archaeon LC_2]
MYTKNDHVISMSDFLNFLTILGKILLIIIAVMVFVYRMDASVKSQIKTDLEKQGIIKNNIPASGMRMHTGSNSLGSMSKVNTSQYYIKTKTSKFILCSACNYGNPVESNFCFECGSSIL